MQRQRHQERPQVVRERLLGEVEGREELVLGRVAARSEGRQVRLEGLDQRGRLEFRQPGQDHPHGERVAAEEVHQRHQVSVLAVDGQPQVAEDDFAVVPPLLALQPAEGDLVAIGGLQPLLVAPAGDDHLGLAAAQLREEGLQQGLVFARQRRRDRRAGDAPDHLEVVPDDEEAVLPEDLGQRVELRTHLRRDELRAEEGLAHAVEDELGGADVLEREPEAALPQAVGGVEPLQEAAGEGGLADAPEPLDQQPRRRAVHGALQRQHGPVAADEAVGVLRIAGLSWKLGTAVGLGLLGLLREREVEGLLLIDDGDQPIVERIPAPRRRGPSAGTSAAGPARAACATLPVRNRSR